MNNKQKQDETNLVHSGYKPEEYHGVVGTPIVRTSTIVYESLAAYEDPTTKYRYGRYGTPLTDQFESALCVLENGHGAIVAPSGLGAITTALFATLNAGDHLLMIDSVYPPTRHFCDDVLTRMGVDVEYYPADIGAGIANIIKENTAAIYMESPGSATYNIQDVPAIVAAAKKRGVVTLLDNSWASGILFKPLDYGVDYSILSCTKYINGHSDAMLGAVVAKDENTYRILKKAAVNIGTFAGSEEVSLGMRGLKTIHIRMKEAGARAMKIAQWLEQRDDIACVFYPALESHPDHALWKRDFTGCNGLLSILLPPASKAAATAFVDGLEIFSIGSSWGGYESLLQPQYMDKCRTAVPWDHDGFLVRLQIGLEHPDDLIADLSQALDKFGETR